MQAEAQAQPNIALVKYWGKRDSRFNLPAVGSISITLNSLVTNTRIHFNDELQSDQVSLDGNSSDEETLRISRFLDMFRELAGTEIFARVESSNNFPTAAGLASSASGFAALAVACNSALGLNLQPDKISELARRGSGSAARSIFGGFVEWHLGSQGDGSDSIAECLLDATTWPLEVVIAITSRERKSISSSRGMNLTMETSPYYRSWIADQKNDLDDARNAIHTHDFEKLADVSEFSCLKMHASAIAARPGIIYWNAASLASMQKIRQLRADGIAVFFTVDAGPQVKAVCLPEHTETVASEEPRIEKLPRFLANELKRLVHCCKFGLCYALEW